MIPLLFLAAAAAATPAPVPLAQIPGSDVARFSACTRLIDADPAKAIPPAQDWARTAADVPSHQCLGMALSAAQRFTDANRTFEQAASMAEEARDGRAGQLWGMAGNAALAADDAPRAHTDLDRALASNGLRAEQRGETWFDRARADVALGDLKQARVAMDAGLKLAPGDPIGWLLSATLARRDHDLDRAETDIGKAALMAPDNADIALEAGNVAAERGVIEAARIAWKHAIELGADEPAGKTAAQALLLNK